MEEISSRQNPLCTHLRKLAVSRAYREQTGEFLCDSPKLLREAVLWNAPVTAVLFTKGTPLPELRDRSDVRLVQVSESVMRAVSPMETPQGIVFTCRDRGHTPPERLEADRCLVLDGVQDPGNVGTILRTADAFDCGAVFLLPGCADLNNPKTVRAAMGVHFRRPVYRTGLLELTALLRAARLPLYAAALRADTTDLRQLDLSRCAVAIGSEGRGVSQTLLERCSGTIQIPMSPRCESLNAAVAAAVILWEMSRSTL